MTISVATFDLSKARTGYATGTPGIANGTARAGWGVFQCTPPTKKDPHPEIADMGRFAELLTDLHDRLKLTHIVWEGIFVNADKFQYFGSATQLHMEGIIMAFCAANKIKGLPVAISAWRTGVYGISRAPPENRVNGKAEDGFWKKKATDWAFTRKWLVEHHDEAEALAILDYALTCLDDTYAARITPLFRRNELDAMHRRGIHAEE